MESTETPPIEAPTENGAGPTEEPTIDPSAETSPAEQRDVKHLFQFSDFVHVGPGAEECDEGETGECANPLHFHAWIRLPNQFQHASIREKALAAKARKLRQLRDPESDERAILDGELDETVRRDDREAFIDELVGKDFLQNHLRAMREIEGEEDSDFATINEDRERLRALEATAEEDRPTEEYEELRKHYQAYNEAVEARRNEIVKPLRDSIENQPIEELRELVFEQRIQAEAQEEFNRTYSLWEWYISTMKPQAQGMPSGKPQLPSERVFADINHLKAAAPEVIEALDQAFTEIEAEASRSMRGF